MKGRTRSADVSPKRLTVLLVEVAQDDRAMYAEYLRSTGFRVLLADNPIDAMMHVSEADVIVTGIRLRGPFDGVELVERLRGGAAKHLPIIVLTACAFVPDQQRALAAGCDLFLSKPCLPDRLSLEILHLLVHRR